MQRDGRVSVLTQANNAIAAPRSQPCIMRRCNQLAHLQVAGLVYNLDALVGIVQVRQAMALHAQQRVGTVIGGSCSSLACLLLLPVIAHHDRHQWPTQEEVQLLCPSPLCKATTDTPRAASGTVVVVTIPFYSSADLATTRRRARSEHTCVRARAATYHGARYRAEAEPTPPSLLLIWHPCSSRPRAKPPSPLLAPRTTAALAGGGRCARPRVECGLAAHARATQSWTASTE
eukprot:scaffold6450_cov415-Prasinococcus_capsulatus_cf.AAC.6